MLLEGEVLQMIAEQKDSLKEVSDRDLGWKQINYFQNNVERMAYDEYKRAGLPIGNGLVEGACKFVVGKRFKGSGMRWKKADNVQVLKGRLAKLNGTLEDYFRARPRSWNLKVS